MIFDKFRGLTKFAARNQSSSAVPFQGWSVTFLPVRSTVGPLRVNFKVDHAFPPARRNELHPAMCLPLRRFGSIHDGGFADTETGQLLEPPEVLIWRVWMIFEQGHIVLLRVVKLDGLCARNHALCREGNLMRAGGANRAWNLEPAAYFEHGDYVIKSSRLP